MVVARSPDERRVLAVSAHPDDAEFTCGGTIARWSDEGWMVHLVVCTDGSKWGHVCRGVQGAAPVLRYLMLNRAAP